MSLTTGDRSSSGLVRLDLDSVAARLIGVVGDVSIDASALLSIVRFALAAEAAACGGSGDLAAFNELGRLGILVEGSKIVGRPDEHAPASPSPLKAVQLVAEGEPMASVERRLSRDLLSDMGMLADPALLAIIRDVSVLLGDARSRISLLEQSCRSQQGGVAR